MFGSKQGKEARLDREVELLEQHEELTVAQLAEKVGVPRKTIYSDLADQEARGVLLQEEDGKVSIYHKT